jgi:very-short-patch-repair endonuclease
MQRPRWEREITARQHGLVTRAQAHAHGLSDDAIRHRVANGHWSRAHRGVYAVGGHPQTDDQRLMAAVLAVGPTASVSHRTAALLWDLPVEPIAAIELTTVLERRARIPGARVHRSGLLRETDITHVRGIPTHTPERIAVELSSRLTDAELGVLVDTALRRRITSLTRLWRCHERLGLAPGRSPKRMQRVLEARVPGITTRESDLEDRVHELIREAGLPLPVPQFEVRIGGRSRRLDFAYPELRLGIECDGFEWHAPRERFDDDRARANELLIVGWSLLRFTSAMSDAEIVEPMRRALHVFGQKLGA